MPLMTAVLSPGDAVLVSCLTGLYGTVHLSYSYRKSCCWREIRDLVVGAVPGCFLGALVLRVASMQTLQLMVCAMLACFIAMQCFHKAASYRLPDSTLIGIAAGFACGFVSGSVAMVGAPLGIYVLMKHWSADRARGNMSVVLRVHQRGLRAFAGLCRIVHHDAVSGVARGRGGMFPGTDCGRASRPPHQSAAFSAHRAGISGARRGDSFCSCHGMVIFPRYALREKACSALPNGLFRDYGIGDCNRSVSGRMVDNSAHKE